MRSILSKAAPLLTLLASVTLTACGTRGNLSQLPGPAQPPVLERWGGTSPAPAPTPAPASPFPSLPNPAGTQGAGDLNTALEAAK